jgi:hypothetical protein
MQSVDATNYYYYYKDGRAQSIQRQNNDQHLYPLIELTLSAVLAFIGYTCTAHYRFLCLKMTDPVTDPSSKNPPPADDDGATSTTSERQAAATLPPSEGTPTKSHGATKRPKKSPARARLLTHQQWRQEFEKQPKKAPQQLDERIRGLDRRALALAPPLSSPIPYLTSKLVGVRLYFTELVDDIDWHDGLRVKAVYPPFGGLGEIRVPACLLIDAVTPQDKLTVVNWWRFLTREEQRQEISCLRNVYAAPTSSNRRLPPDYWETMRRHVVPQRSVDAPSSKDDEDRKPAEIVNLTLTRDVGESWGVDLAQEEDECIVLKVPIYSRLRVRDVILSITPFEFEANYFSDTIKAFKELNELSLCIHRDGLKIDVEIRRMPGESWGVNLKRGDEEVCLVEGAPESSPLQKGDAIFAVRCDFLNAAHGSVSWFQKMTSIFAANSKVHLVVRRYKYITRISEKGRKYPMQGNRATATCRGWTKTEKYGALFEQCFIAAIKGVSMIGSAEVFETIEIPEIVSKAKSAREMHFIKEGEDYVLRAKDCSKHLAPNLLEKKWGHGLCDNCQTHTTFVYHIRSSSVKKTDMFIVDKQQKEIKRLKNQLRNALRRERTHKKQKDQNASPNKRQKVAAESLASLGKRDHVDLENEDDDDGDGDEYDYAHQYGAASRFY